MIADASNPAVDVPALTTSLRGLVEVTVEVRDAGAARALRGVRRGGRRRPHRALPRARLPARRHGEVAIPGLVHGTSDAPDVDEATFRSDVRLLDGVELIGSGTVPDRAG